jgi:hypothetical protein
LYFSRPWTSLARGRRPAAGGWSPQTPVPPVRVLTWGDGHERPRRLRRPIPEGGHLEDLMTTSGVCAVCRGTRDARPGRRFATAGSGEPAAHRPRGPRIGRSGAAPFRWHTRPAAPPRHTSRQCDSAGSAGSGIIGGEGDRPRQPRHLGGWKLVIDEWPEGHHWRSVEGRLGCSGGSNAASSTGFVLEHPAVPDPLRCHIARPQGRERGYAVFPPPASWHP